MPSPRQPCMIDIICRGVVDAAAYVTQILRLGDDVMVLLRCQSNQSASSSVSSSSEPCDSDVSVLGVYARRGSTAAARGVRDDDDVLRHLALDVRTRTLACVRTSPLHTAPRNGRSHVASLVHA